MTRPDPAGGAPVKAPGGELFLDTAAFTFDDLGRIDVFVNLIDGRPLNGKFWVFGGFADRPGIRHPDRRPRHRRGVDPPQPGRILRRLRRRRRLLIHGPISALAEEFDMSIYSKILLGCLAGALAASPLPAALDAWSPLPFITADQIAGRLILTSDRQIAYSLDVVERVLRSEDGGRHWRQVEVPFLVLDLAVGPRDPDLIYAVTYDHLLRGEDGGRHWTPSWLQPRILARSPAGSWYRRIPPTGSTSPPGIFCGAATTGAVRSPQAPSRLSPTALGRARPKPPTAASTCGGSTLARLARLRCRPGGLPQRRPRPDLHLAGAGGRRDGPDRPGARPCLAAGDVRFLVGTHLMRSDDRGATVADLGALPARASWRPIGCGPACYVLGPLQLWRAAMAASPGCSCRCPASSSTSSNSRRVRAAGWPSTATTTISRRRRRPPPSRPKTTAPTGRRCR